MKILIQICGSTTHDVFNHGMSSSGPTTHGMFVHNLAIHMVSSHGMFDHGDSLGPRSGSSVDAVVVGYALSLSMILDHLDNMVLSIMMVMKSLQDNHPFSRKTI